MITDFKFYDISVFPYNVYGIATKHQTHSPMFWFSCTNLIEALDEGLLLDLDL
jgi:hypothetical protein